MSAIAIGLNLLLALLLGAALFMGWRLNRRLKGLRASQEGFALAVGELNAAAARAERGLADLRAASDETSDALGERMEKARALAAKLERLIEQGAPVAAHAPPVDEARAERLGALIAAVHQPRPRLQALADRPERIEPALRAERPERVERTELTDRLERFQRARAERTLRSDRIERVDRAERQEEPLILNQPTGLEDDLFDDAPAPRARALGGRR